MKFASTLLPIAAALRFVTAGPVSAQDLTVRAPVDVTKLVCDGDTYKCTASLDYGKGDWVAQWITAVLHIGSLGNPTQGQMINMAPSPVTALVCDGNTYTCIAKLSYGDGNWIAEWTANVFHQSPFRGHAIGAMAPVPVKSITCDGETFKCTADLDYGDGNWVAQWDTAVFQQGLWSGLSA